MAVQVAGVPGECRTAVVLRPGMGQRHSRNRASMSGSPWSHGVAGRSGRSPASARSRSAWRKTMSCPARRRPSMRVASVAAPAVGGVGDAGAEEPPEAVADSHRVTHQPPPSISPSSPLEARQSRAICGVPQIGLPLTLSEVLISTGTPVRVGEAPQHVGEEGVLAGVEGLHPGGAVGVHDRPGSCRRARPVTGTATDMYGLGWPSWKYPVALSARTTGRTGGTAHGTSPPRSGVPPHQAASGEARIDRFSNARGPASSGPWNSPQIFPPESWAARNLAGSATCRAARLGGGAPGLAGRRGRRGQR